MIEPALPRVNWADVVAVAGRLLPKRGIGKLTLAEIAKELKTDEAAVSYWFQDAGQILIALAEIRNNWFLDEARARMANDHSQTERLRHLIELSAADHDSSALIELWRLSVRDERARQARQAQTDAFRRTIASIIRAGQRTGEFGPVSPDKVALVLAALISGFSITATLKDPAVTPEVMLATLLDAAESLLGVDFAAEAD
jgi:AcrR family transcriptional regulator